MESLNAALKATTEKRGSTELMKQFREIMQAVKTSDIMKRQWDNKSMRFNDINPIVSAHVEAVTCLSQRAEE